MAWRSPCGTKPANNRQFSQAEKRLPSIFELPTSRLPMFFRGMNRRRPRFVHSSHNSDSHLGKSATWETTSLIYPHYLAVGLAACPVDAAAEVKDAAHLITQARGGNGTIREIVEIILKSQGTMVESDRCGWNRIRLARSGLKLAHRR